MSGRRIAILIGGPSAEHDVSLVSGRAIAAALIERGHTVEGWLIGLDGQWWRLPAEAMDRTRAQSAYDDPAQLGADGPHGAAQALSAIAAQQPQPVVFIALHGPFGEDGVVQALCESAGLVYTGAGVAASAIGMDKAIFKRLVEGMGMPVVPWLEIAAADWKSDPAGTHRSLLEFAHRLPDARVIVKPTRLGSSVGISIVHAPDDPEYLGGALTDAFSYGDSVLVEAYLERPRELEMAVLGNSVTDLQTFGPGEIFPGHEFYDFTAKYSDGISRTTGQADVAPDVRARLHDLAARSFLAIGGTGFARVDFLAHNDEIYLNEINTIPGFTPISLFPILCGAGGYDFGAIAERIVDLAVARAADQQRRVLTRADLP